MKKIIYLIIIALICSLSSTVSAEPNHIDESEILRLRIRELELKKEVLELEEKYKVEKQVDVNQQSAIQISDKKIEIKPSAETASRGSHYIKGPRGGCYTYSSSGKKRYVDRSLCN